MVTGPRVSARAGVAAGSGTLSARREPVANLWHGSALAVVLVAGFFAVPILHTMSLSLTSPETGGWTLANYQAFFSTGRLTDSLGRTLFLAFAVVLVSSPIAYALAYYLAFVVAPRWRALLLLLLVAPFWTSFTIRAFAWQLVLSDGGVISYGIGRVIGEQVALGVLYTMSASVFGLSLFAVMLMTLTLFSVMVSIDRRLIEANAALGGTRWRGFLEIILPLSASGWIIGALLTFIVCAGDYAVPTLLGGGFRPVLAQMMVSTLKGTFDLPMAATFAVVLVLTIAVCVTPLLLLIRNVRFQT